MKFPNNVHTVESKRIYRQAHFMVISPLRAHSLFSFFSINPQNTGGSKP